MAEANSNPLPVSPPRGAGPTLRPRRRGWLIGVAVLAVIGLAYGAYRYVWSRTHETTDDAQAEGHVHPIASQVAGYVAAVCAEDNQHVRAGELLVRIRPDDFDARAAQAAAQLAQAQADLQVSEHNLTVSRGTTEAAIAQERASVAQAEAGLDAAHKEVEAARARLAAESAARDQAAAQVQAAQANYDYAAWDRQRVAALYGQNQAAEDELQRTRTAHEAAEANLTAARELVSVAEARVEAAQTAVAAAEAQTRAATATIDEERAKLDAALTGPDQVRVAEARVALARAAAQAAQAQLDFARLQRGYCEITAPVDGVVSERSVEVGQLVQPGQPFLALVPLANTWVVANFKETQLRDMRPGQPVILAVDAYPGHPFRGVVDSIAAGTGARFSLLPPENATGNYVKVVQRVPVKIVLAAGQRDPQRPLRPGMNVVATVDTGAPATRDSQP